jgi:hypothetical protein
MPALVALLVGLPFGVHCSNQAFVYGDGMDSYRRLVAQKPGYTAWQGEIRLKTRWATELEQWRNVSEARVDVDVLRLAQSFVLHQFRLILWKSDLTRRTKKRIFRVAVLASLGEDVVRDR